MSVNGAAPSGIGDRFAGKVALVTGGASGIGEATVRQLVADGAHVMLVDRDVIRAQAVIESLSTDRVDWRQADVGSESDVKAVVEATVDQFGAVDVLVNNAAKGVRMATSAELDPAEWRRVIEVDLHSVFYTAHSVIPHMRRAGGGAIVNVASISGMQGDYGLTAYNAAKGAVINYTRSLALDHARDNIRVNAVCPGFIDTQITRAMPDELREKWATCNPMHRAGRPEELAAGITFAASPAASFMTGSVLVIDGGQSAWTGQPDLLEFATGAAAS